MRPRHFVVSALISASLAALSGSARAEIYDVSTKNRFFCCTNPPALLVGAPSGMGGYHTVAATASVTGSGTPAIKLGMGRAARFYSMQTLNFPLPSIKTARGTFSVSNAAGTLQKGGGNTGSFSFCPKAKGPGPGACTKASKATPASFNGRIKVTPGPKQFGGTLQILAGANGIGGSKAFVYRFLGGSMLDMLPAQSAHQLLVLSPIGAMTPAKQRVDTLPTIPSPTHSVYYVGGRFWQNGAGRFTTGMVTLQVSKNGAPAIRSVMLTGYDNRTPMGVGNIQLVSGLVSNVHHELGGGPTSYPYGWKMRISVIPEPTASLGLAAGALGLLLVGLLRTQRRQSRLYPATGSKR